MLETLTASLKARNSRGLEDLKLSYYLKLNEKEILAPLISFSFLTFKLALIDTRGDNNLMIFFLYMYTFGAVAV